MPITHLFTNTAHKKAKRGGRGIAANLGKTVGRGTKGQKARSGAGRKIKPWFEGGQTPFFRRLAKKRGFNRLTPRPVTVTTDLINHYFKDGDTVSPQTLLEKKVIRQSEFKTGVKVVKRSELKVKITFSGVSTSKSLSQEK